MSQFLFLFKMKFYHDQTKIGWAWKLMLFLLADYNDNKQRRASHSQHEQNALLIFSTSGCCHWYWQGQISVLLAQLTKLSRKIILFSIFDTTVFFSSYFSWCFSIKKKTSSDELRLHSNCGEIFLAIPQKTAIKLIPVSF